MREGGACTRGKLTVPMIIPELSVCFFFVCFCLYFCLFFCLFYHHIFFALLTMFFEVSQCVFTQTHKSTLPTSSFLLAHSHAVMRRSSAAQSYPRGDDTRPVSREEEVVCRRIKQAPSDHSACFLILKRKGACVVPSQILSIL